MLFYIDKTIGKALEASELSEAEISVFHSLAVAVQNGYCIVCGEYHSLSILAARTDNIGVVFSKVLAKYTTHRAIMEKVNLIFCICRGSSEESPSFIADKTWKIQIDKIARLHWNLFQKCILLCENLKDCEYYSLLGMNYCNQNSISEYTVDFTYQGGGGQTTAEMYGNMVCREKRPVLCIVDSDIKHGNNCALGKTCMDVQKMENLFSDSEPPFHTIVLQVHEVENIIPLIILSKIYKANPLIDAYIQLLKSLSSIENGTPLLYYDLKQGHSNIFDTDDMSQYWYNIAMSQELDLSKFSNVFPAIVDRKYLSKAVTLLREIVANRESLEFEACLENIVSQLEQTTFSWGCVGYPMFV